MSLQNYVPLCHVSLAFSECYSIVMPLVLYKYMLDTAYSMLFPYIYKTAQELRETPDAFNVKPVFKMTWNYEKSFIEYRCSIPCRSTDTDSHIYHLPSVSKAIK